MSTIQEWTVEELVAELKRRERRGRSADGLEAAGGGARSIAAPSRAGDLDDVSTAELARMAQDQQRVVYGVDDRKDIFQVTSAKIRKASEAVVALVKGADLEADGNGGWTLATTSYKEEFQLCSSEAFASQPLGCFCSGFLVSPDVIVTAGHCVKSAADLAKMRFVFGFRMVNSSTPRTSFGADDVYEGAALIGRKLTQDADRLGSGAAHPSGRRTLPCPLPDGREDRCGAKAVCDRSPMRTSRRSTPPARPFGTTHQRHFSSPISIRTAATLDRRCSTRPTAKSRGFLSVEKTISSPTDRATCRSSVQLPAAAAKTSRGAASGRARFRSRSGSRRRALPERGAAVTWADC